MAQFRVIKTTEEGLADFEEIKKKFEQYNFHKIRHQVAAPKNRHIEEPAGASQVSFERRLRKTVRRDYPRCYDP